MRIDTRIFNILENYLKKTCTATFASLQDLIRKLDLSISWYFSVFCINISIGRESQIHCKRNQSSGWINIFENQEQNSRNFGCTGTRLYFHYGAKYFRTNTRANRVTIDVKILWQLQMDRAVNLQISHIRVRKKIIIFLRNMKI